MKITMTHTLTITEDFQQAMSELADLCQDDFTEICVAIASKDWWVDTNLGTVEIDYERGK